MIEEAIDRVRAGELNPTEDYCKANHTLEESYKLWQVYLNCYKSTLDSVSWPSHEDYKYYIWIYVKRLNRKTWEAWNKFDEDTQKENAAIRHKKERIHQARVRGGLGKQSPELKAILSEPITFKHSSGVSITVLPQRSVKDVASTLSEISFCEQSNLAKVLVRGSGHSKGWHVIKSSSTIKL
jgi:hypothetical protein